MLTLMGLRTCNLYNEGADKVPGRGRMYGLEGDIRLKVWRNLLHIEHGLIRLAQSEAKRLAADIGKREKHITVLFNNAGILTGYYQHPTEATAAAFVSAHFDAISHDDFTNSLNTNAVGPYWLTFAFLPLLEAWKNSDVPAAKKFVPQIIMTSSMNGWTKVSSRKRVTCLRFLRDHQL